MTDHPRSGSPYSNTGPERPARILVTTSTYPVHLDDAARHERRGALDVRRFAYFPVRGLQRLALGSGIRDNLRASWLARFQVPLYLVAQARATRVGGEVLCEVW